MLMMPTYAITRRRPLPRLSCNNGVIYRLVSFIASLEQHITIYIVAERLYDFAAAGYYLIDGREIRGEDANCGWCWHRLGRRTRVDAKSEHEPVNTAE